MPILPGEKQGNGWKPMRHFPTADMMPGELAPTSLDLDCVLRMEWIFAGNSGQYTHVVQPLFITPTYPEHVMERDMLGHGNDKRHLCFNSLLNGAGGLVSCYIDARCVWLQLLHSLPYS